MSFRALAGPCVATLISVPAAAQSSFVNWESAHVHPLDVSADGLHVLAVNTADNRLEIFRVDEADTLAHVGSVPVGLDPVSVRHRTADEAWVVNFISDSISVVDLAARAVTATIPLGDEPGDVVFAEGRAFVSLGTENEVWVYDLPHDPATPPVVVTLAGDTPRALGTDGHTVHAAIFHAGNRTTVLNHAFVTNPAVNPYSGDPNPPPNDGAGFKPPINPALLIDEDNDGELDIRMPRSSMILRMNDDGDWVDDNGGNWSAESTANLGTPVPWWTLHGNALAHIDAQTLAVSYTTDLMTVNTALDVGPAGAVAVVGIHSHNHVRFEPNLNGRFVTNGQATVVPGGGGGPVVVAINPHLAQFQQFEPATPGVSGVNDVDAVPTLPPDERAQSLGDPRGVALSPGGEHRLITGRGSNNLIKTDASGVRLGRVDVGEGPTGVRFHPTHERAYVLNKFDASISIIDTAAFEETTRVPFHDPTPAVIRTGRKHLYNTHLSSGLGTVSCQSCHLNGDMDGLGWDLGDPSGDMKEFNQTCIGGGIICDATDWHPMKGPMTTQTLVGIVGTEPFHWRGDREDLAAFNGAFVSLLAGELKSDAELQEFEDFVATLTFPPNPYRQRDGDLAPLLFNGGDPRLGEFLFLTPPVIPALQLEDDLGPMTHPKMGDFPGTRFPGGGFNCNGCHSVPTGTNTQILRPFIADTVTGLHHLTKVAQLRNMYRKRGFDAFAGVPQNRGFGFLHDGSFDTLQNFLQFFFAMSAQTRLDVEAFLLSFAGDTHAGVGSQVTLAGIDGDDVALRDQMRAIAGTGGVGLVVKGVVDGHRRGYYALGGNLYQSDRVSEVASIDQLDAAIAAGVPLTWTLVPAGTEVRIGVDRDGDGFFDRDEIDRCADPADPSSTPDTIDPACCETFCADHPECCGLAWSGECAQLFAGQCPTPAVSGDADGDGRVDGVDLLAIFAAWGVCDDGPCPADVTGNRVVDVDDLIAVMGAMSVN